MILFNLTDINFYEPDNGFWNLEDSKSVSSNNNSGQAFAINTDNYPTIYYAVCPLVQIDVYRYNSVTKINTKLNQLQPGFLTYMNNNP